MKDFLPTFTFGFLMAQLFPGAVTVLCLSCPYLVVIGNVTIDPSVGYLRMMDLFTKVGDVWFGSTRNAVVFLFLSAATGMFLHGLDWMVLGWETTERDNQGKPVAGLISVRDFPFHNKVLWLQLVIGPFHILLEIFHLFQAPELKWIALDENAPEIDPLRFPLFNWLQDFYLYFGQFYVHMAYALLLSTASLIVTYWVLGISRWRILLLLALYLLTGLFFLMGRTQLASLFKNERSLIDASSKTPPPLEIVVSAKP